MTRIASITIFCVTALAAGCDGGKPPEATKPAAAPASSAPDLAKSQRDVMDQAKDVGRVLQEGDDARRKSEEK